MNQFASNQSVVFSSGASLLAANFTISFWALPFKSQPLPAESNTSPITTSDLQTVISSEDFGDISVMYGLSVAVSTNGVVVYESLGDSFSLLTAEVAITQWSYVTVAVLNNIPTLYINGIQIRSGLVSSGILSFKLASFGSSFSGAMDNVLLHNLPLTPSLVLALYQANKSQGTRLSCLDSLDHPSRS